MPSKAPNWNIEIRIKNRRVRISPKELAALRRSIAQVMKNVPDVSWRMRPRPWLQVLPVKGKAKPRAKTARRR